MTNHVSSLDVHFSVSAEKRTFGSSHLHLGQQKLFHVAGSFSSLCQLLVGAARGAARRKRLGAAGDPQLCTDSSRWQGGGNRVQALRMEALLQCRKPRTFPGNLVALMFCSQGERAEMSPGNPTTQALHQEGGYT